MLDYEQLKERFAKNTNVDRAKQMKKYMRNQFEFYGYQTRKRKALYHRLLLAEKKQDQIDWELLDHCWQDPYREMQYFVCDYLIAMKKKLNFTDISKIERYARSKQWWDTIDTLVKPLGYLTWSDPRGDKLMLEWSRDSDFWIRRVAIEYQLLRKQATNTQVLSKIIQNNLESDEFFINKAIGWVLRDYSKTNPEWVRDFIKQNQQKLAPLSIREGSKYL
ncbi:DNA alkylation repair protein [Limosilactobacillus caviae]|uniref:DNA alkylation repair protein n=1 Tax=Limosilactobacillus caviae TaxID=1769424 RepID=UPI00129A6517|nr:DNA alkylation repair protein [Limosilactobacillus caviae]MCD7124780.1 DNA alkylation repair protein [Limosilactobacillus caviae]MRH45577.1 DNA alkylation repair protein [Limosilactobacillus reuteri]